MNRLPHFYKIEENELTREGQIKRLNMKKKALDPVWKDYVLFDYIISNLQYTKYCNTIAELINERKIIFYDVLLDS